jgi:hypothetical protein
MKKAAFIILFLSLLSCKDKAVLLPQVDQSIVTTLNDHSPIYMFLKTEGKDTLIDVNRKNSISSTNWIFNIDKRLPLRLVVPEVIKLQAKKAGSAHKSAASENYFSYSDSIQKQLAFIPFTKLTFTLEQPKYGVNIYFAKNSTVFVNAVEVKKDYLKTYLSHLPSEKPLKFNYCFDKNSSYGSFVKELVFAQTNGLQLRNIFVY